MNRPTLTTLNVSGPTVVARFQRAAYGIVLFCALLSVNRPCTAQWKHVRSNEQPIAISYHEGQVNRHLARRLRMNRRIVGRPLTPDEVSLVVRARTNILRQLLEWSEIAYEKEVHELGFAKPAGIWREYDGKEYLHIFLVDYGEQHGGMTFGSVSRADSALRLNIRAFWRTASDSNGHQRRSLRGTVAHELFHAIQNQYAVHFSRWAKESTAEWCVEQVFPDQNHFVSRQSRFIRHPEYSLHQVYRAAAESHSRGSHSHHRYAGNLGRPYGASAFWMFLDPHLREHDANWMKSVWENARATDDAYEALGKLMGDSGPLGPNFRKYFTRYAVGSLLHDAADADYRLHDVELLKESRGSNIIKVRPPDTNLKEYWDRHLNHSLTEPDSAVMSVKWKAASTPVTSQAGPDFETSSPLGISGTAYRIFRVPTSANNANQLPLRLEVEGTEPELTLSAIVKREGRWHVFHSRYDAAHQRHNVTVPAGEFESNYAYFVVCRFSRELNPKTYELCFSAIEPPSVARITMNQGTRRLFEAKWTPTDPSHPASKRVKYEQTALELPATDGPPLELVVEFTHAVREADQPVCRWNSDAIALQPAESDRIWRAKLPVTKLLDSQQRDHVLRLHAELKIDSTDAHIPLDENPVTQPFLAADRRSWTDYERTAAGMTVKLKMPPTYVAKLSANSMVRQQTHGPVWVTLSLDENGFGKMDQPYVVEVKLGSYRQYLYPTNVGTYDSLSHPLKSLNSFMLPERLTDALPNRLTATFVTRNGDRLEKEFELDLQPPATSTFGGSPDEISNELAECRTRLERALAKEGDAERRFSVCVREGSSIITYTDRMVEAERVWRATQDAFKAAQREPDADSAWLERKFSEVERAIMGTAYRFQRTDLLLETLRHRSSRGQSTLIDYIGVIDACVRFDNDVEMAHKLWDELKQLPESKRKPERSGFQENWKFTYDTLADYSQELNLPKQPISID